MEEEGRGWREGTGKTWYSRLVREVCVSEKKTTGATREGEGWGGMGKLCLPSARSKQPWLKRAERRFTAILTHQCIIHIPTYPTPPRLHTQHRSSPETNPQNNILSNPIYASDYRQLNDVWLGVSPKLLSTKSTCLIVIQRGRQNSKRDNNLVPQKFGWVLRNYRHTHKK